EIPPPASALPRPAAHVSNQTTTGAGSWSGSKTWWRAAINSPPPPGHHHIDGEALIHGTRTLADHRGRRGHPHPADVRLAGRVRRVRGGRPHTGRRRRPGGASGD